MDVLGVEDILNVAIYMEDDGRDFYTAMAERFREEPSVGDLFTFMAEQEAEHKEAFREMLNAGIGRDPASEQDYPGEYRQYLNVYMQSHTIGAKKGIKKKMDRVETIADATEVAVELENDSIVFYNSLRPMLPLTAHPVLARVVKEEYGHIVRIHEYRRDQLQIV